MHHKIFESMKLKTIENQDANSVSHAAYLCLHSLRHSSFPLVIFTAVKRFLSTAFAA